MYGYQDYYDEQLKEQPYAEAGEEVADYCNLVDLILEDFAYAKGLGTDTGLFARGLSITEKEMVEYYTDSPSLRKPETYDLVCGEDVEKVCAHIKSRTEASSLDTFLPVRNLRTRWSLSDQEVFAILLAYVGHTGRNYERIFGFLQDDIQCHVPTFGLYQTLVERYFGESDSAENKSLYAALFASKRGLVGGIFRESYLNSSYPLRGELVLTTCASQYLSGLRPWDMALHPLLEQPEATALPVFYTRTYNNLIQGLQAAEGCRNLYVEGKDSGAVSHICNCICKETGRRFYRISLRELLWEDTSVIQGIVETLSFVFRVESCLLLVMDVTPEILEEPAALKWLLLLLRHSSIDPVVLCGSAHIPEALRGYESNPTSLLPVSLTKAEVSTRLTMWTRFLKLHGIKAGANLDPADIADCYELEFTDIDRACKQAKLAMAAEGDKKLSKDALLGVLKGIGTANFKGLAKEVKTVYTWEDIQMNGAEKQILLTACNRYKMRNRIGETYGITKKNAYGNGVSVLLYGPPGTGKTMASQIVAREVGLPLYRVDTSQLFSKYIGETEKNLNSVFDEADKSNVILFFDEADALFSKRTNVESSNDRHANQEIAFLLQRIEEYKGMSLLATNYYSGFDKAFVRRITYAVRLEQPDANARKQLWENVLPQEVPRSKDIDAEFLAQQFELTGSNIKSILLSAAYMAAYAQDPLSMKHIIKAMKYEFDKLGMMPDSAKFGPYASYLYQE